MSESAQASLLFTPLTCRGFTAPNRVMVSPMQQYASDDSGRASDFHLVQLGRFAMGGAGMVIAEATAIEPIGRMSHMDLGLWSDEQVAPLTRIAAFIASQGSIPGIQLVHAGRKGSMQAPWDGMGPLTEADTARGEEPWETIGPSAISPGSGWSVPREMTAAEIVQNVALWAAAARRAAQAGFRIIDLHGAHGYLLHAFLSPISNHRTDAYGGSLKNRMRYPLEVVSAIRAAIPDDCALFYRLSVLDGIEGGWTEDDSLVFCRELLARGVDLIDCSSGGAISDRSSDVRVRRGYAFHAPYSRKLRQNLDGGLVATVGLIVDPHQAEAVLQAGDADVVAIGRELLEDPNWPHHARSALNGESYDDWPQESGWWLDKRVGALRKLKEAGETPMTRYETLAP
ncbi:NADH:flavin oxidoreductase/NADH oxidase [Novosphingobium cyanobacteriorum]|uniref:NADH:flavin oxidoreductase/NADH oxidase n=1 Tax=Novosphingobium cyanobacteriorum TaxID=3024215 RepID=A0ABT6CN64_9SPHN|nr:NADH:flavin oxidoreductase/NADH oxidase [Novosphingobium cyanobacteriorum]MDF8334954.1 NADH:flavin oxidoreductase/NADH oxidase [Novosphingobium cyanobacteriorum]